MHVLITRPGEDGAALKSRAEALGCTASLAPLIEIALENISADAFASASAVVATSRNALRAIGQSPALEAAKSLPLYVVGPGSARLASDLDFKDIREGQGTAADLVGPLLAAPEIRRGPVVYLMGDVTAFDLTDALFNNGVNVVTVAAYRSVAANALPGDVVRELKAKSIDAAILMSPRTAEIWAKIATKEWEAIALQDLTHICLSEAVASALKAKLPQTRTSIADRPTVEHVLALIKRLATQARAE